jgi:hypothetical protein
MSKLANQIELPACPESIEKILAGRALRIGVKGEKPKLLDVSAGKSTVTFEAEEGEEIHAELLNTLVQGEGVIEQAMLRFKSGQTAGNELGLWANKPAEPKPARRRKTT